MDLAEAVILIAASLGITSEESDAKHSDRLSLSSLLLIDLSLNGWADKMARADWTRDELIVTLDFYLKHPDMMPGKTSPEILELSNFLNRLGDQIGASKGEKFRNPNGVYMKLMNFRRFDPNYDGKGLERGGKQDEVVWNTFANDPANLAKVAASIRSDVSPFLNALPLSINALYQIWFIIKDDAIDDTTFRTLFKTTPKRTDVSQSLKDAKTPDTPLIHPHATAAELLLWRKNWIAPPEKKLPRGDKRTLLLAAVTVSGELFDFKLGGHTGCVDLVEVREAIERLEAAVEKLNKGAEKFLVLSNETYLSEGYTRREENSQFDRLIEVKAKKRAEAKALREKIAKAKAKGIKVRKPKSKPVDYKKLQALDLSKVTGFIK